MVQIYFTWPSKWTVWGCPIGRSKSTVTDRLNGQRSNGPSMLRKFGPSKWTTVQWTLACFNTTLMLKINKHNPLCTPPGYKYWACEFFWKSEYPKWSLWHACFWNTKKLQVPEYVKHSQNWKSGIWKSSNSPLEALEDKKQGWHYAEVLHLETGLQDTSLQSQQGATNLAIPASASAGGWAVGQDRLGTSPCLQQHHIAVLLCCHAWAGAFEH